MTAVPAEMFDRLAEALAEIRPRFGAAGFAERRRVIALVSDKVPEARREIRAIGTAIDEGVPEALARTERHLLSVEMDRQASSLESATGLRIDIARQVVRCFAFASGVGPPPSAYEEAPCVPATDAGSWAGISQADAVEPRRGAPDAPLAGARPKLGKLGLALGGGVALLVAATQFLGPADPQVQERPAAQGFAGELADQGVRAKSELEPNVGSPTPMTIPVGRRVTTAEVRQMISEDSQVILVDVLANPHPSTLRGAAYLPSGGMPGTFEDSDQRQFAQALSRLSAGATSRPFIFFCAGASCWESYNAVLRANAAGYSRIYWYRGGLASWTEAGLPMEPLPAPGQATANFKP